MSFEYFHLKQLGIRFRIQTRWSANHTFDFSFRITLEQALDLAIVQKRMLKNNV